MWLALVKIIFSMVGGLEAHCSQAPLIGFNQFIVQNNGRPENQSPTQQSFEQVLSTLHDPHTQILRIKVDDYILCVSGAGCDPKTPSLFRDVIQKATASRQWLILALSAYNPAQFEKTVLTLRELLSGSEPSRVIINLFNEQDLYTPDGWKIIGDTLCPQPADLGEDYLQNLKSQLQIARHALPSYPFLVNAAWAYDHPYLKDSCAENGWSDVKSETPEETQYRWEKFFSAFSDQIEYLGLNYYAHPESADQLKVHASALTRKFHLPLIITEMGLSTQNDSLRALALSSQLKSVLETPSIFAALIYNRCETGENYALANSSCQPRPSYAMLDSLLDLPY